MDGCVTMMLGVLRDSLRRANCVDAGCSIVLAGSPRLLLGSIPNFRDLCIMWSNAVWRGIGTVIFHGSLSSPGSVAVCVGLEIFGERDADGLSSIYGSVEVFPMEVKGYHRHGGVISECVAGKNLMSLL